MIWTHRIAALIKSKITNTYWPYYQPIFLLLVFDLASKIEFIDAIVQLRLLAMAKYNIFVILLECSRNGGNRHILCH